MWSDRPWLQPVALATLLAGIAFGMLVPIYTDEIAWRFHERAWLDGGFDVWLNDVCGPGSIARAPQFMMPVRWFSATMNQLLADPLYVRLTGVILALALVAGFWRLVGLLEQDRTRRRVLRACALALLATGYLPTMLVLSRPEQPLFLAVMGMVLVTLSGDWRARDARSVWLASGAIVLLCLLALSYHLKGVLYSVFALACLAMLVPGARHWLPRALGGVTIVVANLIAAPYWISRFACPDSAVMAKELEEQNLTTVIQNGNATLGLIGEQLLNSHIFAYTSVATLPVKPMSQWLPHHVFGPVEEFGSDLVTIIGWAVASLIAVRTVALAIRAQGWSALFQPRLALLLVMAGTTLVWGFSQVTKNSYEAMHILPAWIVVLLLAWTLPQQQSRPLTEHLGKLAVMLMAFAALSQVVVIVRMAPSLVAATEKSGTVRLQNYSLSLVDYDAVRQDIDRAMAQAGMAGPQRLHRLMIDDHTYLALQRHYLPLHALGVTGVWRGPVSDPAAYLVDRGSDGVVVACKNLWDEARAVASRSGEFCAVNKAQLATLAGGRPFQVR